MVTKEFEFGKIDAYGRGRKVNKVTVEVTLKTNKNGFPVFTASGEIWNASGTDIISAGQMLDNIKTVPVNNALFQEIKSIWRKYHLNDLHAGTKAQEAALKKAGITGRNYSYDRAVTYLKQKGMWEVTLTPTERKWNPQYAGKPYRYGHGWLYQPIAPTDLAKIQRILNGNWTVKKPVKKTPAPFGL